MLSPFMMKIGGALLLAAVVAGALQYGKHWKNKATAYNTEAARLVDGIRVVSRNPNMERKDALTQLMEVGKARDLFEQKLEECSGRVDALGAETAARLRDAEAAVSASQERRKLAEATRDRLLRSSRSGEEGGCLSDTLKRQWQ